MRGIKDRVAIIGMGCTKFGERWDASAADLMVEASYEAFADAGIEPKDIQAAWLGTVSSFRTGQPLAEALKLDYIPITRVENACATATDAFRNACYAVAAGIYDIVLAVGVEKLKDSGFSGLAIPESPGSDVNPPTPPPAQFAMAATRYFHQYEIPYDEGRRTLARIAVKNHHNGTLNPRAHFQREITTEQVVNAPMIAWPLGLFDCCGVSDGSAAAIITTPEIARSFRTDYILVKALGGEVGRVEGGDGGIELGWHEVCLTDVGREDPILSGQPWRSMQVHWHREHLQTPPAGARVLACSQRSPVQAWALGLRTYGFQYHPEVDENSVKSWAAEEPQALQEARITIERLDEETRRYYPAFKRLSDRLFELMALYLMPADRRIAGLVKDLHH